MVSVKVVSLIAVTAPDSLDFSLEAVLNFIVCKTVLACHQVLIGLPLAAAPMHVNKINYYNLTFLIFSTLYFYEKNFD